VGIGWSMRQRVLVHAPVPPAGGSTNGISSSSVPLATTRIALGARTVHSTVALSLGWSMLGIQRRARSGQLSPK
jgi:hypothetical protein